MTDGEYGIVANCCEPDKIFRLGAKSWIAGGTGGEGWHRFEWIAHARNGHVARKWAPTARFNNFRAKWIPEAMREHITYLRGDRPTMEATAIEMNAFADTERSKTPGRRSAPDTTT